MSLFDSIVSPAREMFDLGNKADSLLAALLEFMTDTRRGGFNGFLERFGSVGLGDLVSTWIAAGDNTRLSNEQVESVLTDEEIGEIAAEAGVDKQTATSGLAFMIPHVIDNLTPDGVLPEEKRISAKVKEFLSGTAGSVDGAGVAPGVMTTGAVDRVGTAAGDTIDKGAAEVGRNFDMMDAGATEVEEKSAGDFARFDDRVGGDSQDSILNYIMPLLLLALLVILGFWFCGRGSTPVTTVGNSNSSMRPPASNTNTAVH